MSSWQRLIAALEDGPLRAYEACRQAGYSPNASPHAVLATATAHCPRLCEWVEGAQVWVGLVSPGGEYVIGEVARNGGVVYNERQPGSEPGR